MNIKHILIIYFFSLLAFTTNAQSTIETQINSSFNKLIADPSLKNGIASIVVADAENGKIIYEKNSTTGLPTASTLKVITTITALDLIGGNFVYKTKVYYAGEIDSLGILHGDIVIAGSGDPTLGSHRFESTQEEQILSKWKKAIQTAGIDSIAGRIIADDRFFKGNDVPGGWLWDDMGNYYGAGISGLNWRENMTGVKFRAGVFDKEAVVLGTTSDISYLEIINNVKTGGKRTGDQVYAYSAPYSEKIVLRGTYGQDLNKVIQISIPDPAYDLAYQFQKYLAKDSIFVENGITTGQLLIDQGGSIPRETRTIDIHISPKLSEIIYWFNQKSINLYGESILKMIGYFSGGTISTAKSADYVKKYWAQKLQIPSSELDIIDGSGLSPQNHVTTSAMNKIMQYAITRPWFSLFQKSLPIFNQLTMKSGTIGGTLGYTGYHQAKNGKRYTFSLLVYNYQGVASEMRQKMFHVLDVLK